MTNGAMTSEKKLQHIDKYINDRIYKLYHSEGDSSYARMGEVTMIKNFIRELDESATNK